MSTAPPGFPTQQTDPARDNHRSDADVQYELKSVQAVRGRESSAKAKWHNQGWELVSENRGKLRTELNFRRVKPKTFVAHLLSIVAPVRRLQTKTQLVMVAICARIVAAGVGIIAVTQREGDGFKPGAAQTTASPAPSAEPSVTAPPAQPVVTDTTVDELLDKLNSAGFRGITLGDQFRVTGELFESDAWGTGASGDFVVYLKAKDGADDLAVFVDESDASGWQDGTTVELVVESVQATIDGETTDGWLKARSAEVISEGPS